MKKKRLTAVITLLLIVSLSIGIVIAKNKFNR